MTAARGFEPFDLAGPLPTGTTLLEASAGTGKTYTVGALVTRWVAEGAARLEEMLIVTFGRAASQELRERVRAQLVEAERALSDPQGADRSHALLALLLDADADELATRRRRLRAALAGFDAATIATTHQFCQLVLRSLGVAGDTDGRAELVDNLADLVQEVVDDLYLRRFGGLSESPPFGRETALALGHAAVGDPHAALVPAGGSLDTPAAVRASFAREVAEEVDRRKRRQGMLSYDDLLSRLADALADSDAPARDRMRRRWRIVLVDEFQDTDPVQWTVLDRAFSGHASLVLVGDPKQAIYAFRGGDVVAYLAAAASATTRATLATNWRSDAPLVERLQVVLRGAALGSAQIVVRSVTAAHASSRLAGLPQPAPFRLRIVDRARFGRGGAAAIPVKQARAFIAEDCAADIAAVLAAGATYDGEPLCAGEIAVLIAKRTHGELVQAELRRRGIPAVLTGGGQIFSSPAADDWLALLRGLEAPHRSNRVRAAALTAFLGESARSLDTGGDRLTDEVADVLRGWALLLRSRGVAAMFAAVEERGLSARVLAVQGGERLLTDLRHLAEIMHERVTRDRLGLAALLRWFAEERAREHRPGDRTRRLDSDAAAVQIVTIHASKGLQYPLTYLPFGYERYVPEASTARFHDSSGRRTLDVGGSGPGWSDHEALARAEEAGEELRQLYVALTRARSQVVAWWAPTTNTPDGGLHRLLFGRQPGVAEVPDQVALRDDEYVGDVLAALEQLGGPQVEPAVVAEPPTPPHDAAAPVLAARPFDRTVDTAWRRTSYSGLIRIEEATAGSGGVGSEPEVEALPDEPARPEPAVQRPAPAAASSVPSPMADLPSGATFGSLVHAVLEHADPDAPDLTAELTRNATEQLRWWPVPVAPERLAEALVPVLHTPMGPLASHLTLVDVPLRDRLCELDFELPLAGGDRPPGDRGPGDRARAGRRPRSLRLRDLAPVLRDHLTTDDPLRPYADRLEAPALGDQRLSGYLAGSVDAVLRIPDPESAGGHRFVVVDYKTNLLGDPTRPASAADYSPDRLAAAMLGSHYPLQALLYQVVLHRYLRWRLTGYTPASHLGGVLYLFLRGMCGPDTPLWAGVPAGVFGWHPPASLAAAVSDLLDREPHGDAR